MDPGELSDLRILKEKAPSTILKYAIRLYSSMTPCFHEVCYYIGHMDLNLCCVEKKSGLISALFLFKSQSKVSLRPMFAGRMPPLGRHPHSGAVCHAPCVQSSF